MELPIRITTFADAMGDSASKRIGLGSTLALIGSFASKIRKHITTNLEWLKSYGIQRSKGFHKTTGGVGRA